ncbi:MAG: hypothetical protein ACK414_12515, partial [Gemmobacter sp.]
GKGGGTPPPLPISHPALSQRFRRNIARRNKTSSFSGYATLFSRLSRLTLRGGRHNVRRIATGGRNVVALVVISGTWRMGR